MTQQYCLASMAAWLSSTGISHHNLIPRIPLSRLSTVNKSPCPGISPQALNSSSHPLPLPGDPHAWHMYGFGKDCLILIPFRLLQISCFTLRLKCFSSDSDNCPTVGIRLLLQFPYPLKTGPTHCKRFGFTKQCFSSAMQATVFLALLCHPVKRGLRK